MMAALLVAMSVMAVLMGALLPVWGTAARREREAELVFRGEQYARAIGLFQRKYANARPPSIDVLVEEKFLRKKYLDPMTGAEFQVLTAGSPMAVGGPGAPGAPGAQGGLRGQQPPSANPGARGATAQPPRAGGAGPTPTLGAVPMGGAGVQGGGGIIGVTSRSTESSLRIYNGKQKYNEWAFLPVQMNVQAGAGAGPGAQAPGAGGRGAPGGRGVPPGMGGPPGLGGRGAPGGNRGQGSGTQPFGTSPFGQDPFGDQGGAGGGQPFGRPPAGGGQRPFGSGSGR